MIASGYGYPCKAGETFDSVSLALYKHERYAADLMAANPDLCHLLVFTGGEVLIVPVVEQTEIGGRAAPSTAPWK